MTGLIDTHIHLTDPPYGDDDRHLMRAMAAPGLETLIVPAYDAASCRAVIRLKHRFPELPVAVGFHPCHLESARPDLSPFFDAITPAAVGEIGLDRRRSCTVDFDTQITAFESQLRTARERRLPVILHCVRAHPELLRMLNRNQPLTGVLHRANCSPAEAERYLSLGFRFGFGPDLLREQNQKLRRLAALIPLNRILLETDSPYTRLPDGSAAGPEHLPRILNTIAQLHDTSPDHAARIIRNNTIALFHLPLPPETTP